MYRFQEYLGDTNNAVEILNWITKELTRIEAAFTELALDRITLNELHAEPPKPRDGLTVLADGTDWNPGSGQGVYTYYNSVWNKLG